MGSRTVRSCAANSWAATGAAMTYRGLAYVVALCIAVMALGHAASLTMTIHNGSAVTTQPITGFTYMGPGSLDVYTDRIFYSGFEP